MLFEVATNYDQCDNYFDCHVQRNLCKAFDASFTLDFLAQRKAWQSSFLVSEFLAM